MFLEAKTIEYAESLIGALVSVIGRNNDKKARMMAGELVSMLAALQLQHMQSRLDAVIGDTVTKGAVMAVLLEMSAATHMVVGQTIDLDGDFEETIARVRTFISTKDKE